MHMLTIFTEEKGHAVSDDNARQDMPPAIQSTLDVMAWDRQMLEKVLHWLRLKLPRRSSNVFPVEDGAHKHTNRPRTSHGDFGRMSPDERSSSARTIVDCSPDERSSSSLSKRWNHHDSPFL